LSAELVLLELFFAEVGQAGDTHGLGSATVVVLHHLLDVLQEDLLSLGCLVSL